MTSPSEPSPIFLLQAAPGKLLSITIPLSHPKYLLLSNLLHNVEGEAGTPDLGAREQQNGNDADTSLPPGPEEK